MRITGTTSLLLLTCLFVRPARAAAARKPTQGVAVANSPKPNAVARQYLVKFKSVDEAAKRADVFAKYQVVEREQVGSGPLYLVEVPESLDANQIKTQLARDPAVQYVEPNLILRTMPATADDSSHDKKLRE